MRGSEATLRRHGSRRLRCFRIFARLLLHSRQRRQRGRARFTSEARIHSDAGDQRWGRLRVCEGHRVFPLPYAERRNFEGEPVVLGCEGRRSRSGGRIERGVVFEHYDFPGTDANGITTAGGAKAAGSKTRKATSWRSSRRSANSHGPTTPLPSRGKPRRLHRGTEWRIRLDRDGSIDRFRARCSSSSTHS